MAVRKGAVGGPVSEQQCVDSSVKLDGRTFHLSTGELYQL